MVTVDKYKAYFFDFDGVIVDSLSIKGEAFGSLFTEYGQEIVNRVVEYHFNNGGVSRYDKFKYYYNELLGKEITPDIIDDLDRQYSNRVVERVVAAPEIDGVTDFIEGLNGKGKPCFVVSATPQEEVSRIAGMRGLGGMFEEITGSPRKKSENLGYLMEKYSVQGEDAVFFGDAKSDYNAAVENGVDFIGVVTGNNAGLKDIDGVPKIDNFRTLTTG